MPSVLGVSSCCVWLSILLHVQDIDFSKGATDATAVTTGAPCSHKNYKQWWLMATHLSTVENRKWILACRSAFHHERTTVKCKCRATNCAALHFTSLHDDHGCSSTTEKTKTQATAATMSCQTTRFGKNLLATKHTDCLCYHHSDHIVSVFATAGESYKLSIVIAPLTASFS